MSRVGKNDNFPDSRYGQKNPLSADIHKIIVDAEISEDRP